MTLHTHTGNCFNVPLWCKACDAMLCDRCHKHQHDRGDCTHCPPCPACGAIDAAEERAYTEASLKDPGRLPK